jgi:hypothetical protein
MPANVKYLHPVLLSDVNNVLLSDVNNVLLSDVNNVLYKLNTWTTHIENNLSPCKFAASGWCNVNSLSSLNQALHHGIGIQ